MFFVYEIIQEFLYLIIKISSKLIKNKKFKRFCDLRDPFLFKREIYLAKSVLEKDIKNGKNYPIYWFHISSAGEMEQAIPIAQKLNDKIGSKFFVTYYSPSTEPFLKNFPNKIGCIGLPIDIQKYYKIVFENLPIDKIFFVRYDIWPSLIKVCLKYKVEINLLSASRNKTKKGFLGFFSEIWNKKFYSKFSNIFAVSKIDQNYFRNYLSKENVFLAGDAKWSRALERARNVPNNNDKDFSLLFSFCIAQKEHLLKKCVVFGSPHSDEHKLALDISSLKEKLLIIYVPHSVNKNNCLSILRDFNFVNVKAVLLTELVKRIENELNIYDFNPSENDFCHNELKLSGNFYKIRNHLKFSHELMSSCDVIVVDRIGFLAEIYELGDIAIIGGGFDGQIHNVLEAAAHGVPVLVGNLYSRALEVSELVNAGGAISFQNRNELFQFLVQWVSLIESGTDESTHPTRRLSHAKAKTLQLFKSIPDTSEIIFQALFFKGNRERN